MQTYQDMKSSGIAWLGEVPRNWDLVRPRFMFTDRKEKSRTEDIHLTPSQKYAVLPQAEYMKLSGGRVVLNLTGSENMKHVEKGDFVIHLRSFQGGIEYSAYTGKVSNAYTVLNPNDRICHAFFKYVLKSHGFISELASKTDQLRDGQSIKFSTFDLVMLPVPDASTQVKIASYLDTETAKIDKLIARQERMLELLEEKRRATITHAVTRGLNPHVELKETNISWLGKIPTCWDTARIGSLFKQRNEKVSDKDYLPLSVTKNGIVPQLEDAAKSNDGDNRKKVLKGDFVINSRSDRKGSSGISELDGSVSLINTVLMDGKLASRYAHHLFRSKIFQEEFYRWGQGIVADLWTTNYQKMKAIYVPTPSVMEQEEVASFLDRAEQSADNLKRKIQTQITLLRERRTSLISHAVTGKIKI